MAEISIVEVVGSGPGYTTVLASDGNTYTLEGVAAWRNNNPGNLRPGSLTNGLGPIGVANTGSNGEFLVFPDYETGLRAQEALQFDVPTYANKTILEAIRRYAPTGDNNDPDSYAQALADAAGVSVNTRLSDLTPSQRRAYMRAQHGVENNQAGTIRGPEGKPVPQEFASLFNNGTPRPARDVPMLTASGSAGAAAPDVSGAAPPPLPRPRPELGPDRPLPFPGPLIQTARALGNAGSVGAGVALGSSPLNDRLPNDAGYGVQLASASPVPDMTPGQSYIAPSSRGSPFVDTGAAMERLRAPARALGPAPVSGSSALGAAGLAGNSQPAPHSPLNILSGPPGALGATPVGPLAGALSAVGGAAPTAAARLVDIHDRRDAVPAAAPPTPVVAGPVAPTPLPPLARPTVAAAPTPMPAPARPAASAPSQTAPQATVTNASAPAQELVRLPSGKMVAPGTYENASNGISYTVSAGPNGTGIVTPNRAGAVNLGREMNAPTLLGGMIRARVPEAVEAGLGAARDSFAPVVEGVQNAATNAIETLAPSVQGIGSTLSNAFGGAFGRLTGGGDAPPAVSAVQPYKPTKVAPQPLPSPSFFRGSGSGREYAVGKIYSNANGNFIAQADGTFRPVTSGSSTSAAAPRAPIAALPAPESRAERFTNLDAFGNII